MYVDKRQLIKFISSRYGDDGTGELHGRYYGDIAAEQKKGVKR